MGRPNTFGDESGVVLETPIARRPSRSSDEGRGADPPAPPATKSSFARPPVTRLPPPRQRRAVGSTPPRASAATAGLRSALPWLLLFMVLGGAGGVALWGWQKYGILGDQAARVEDEARALGEKAARLEGEVLSLGTELEKVKVASGGARTTAGKARGDLDALEARLGMVVTDEKGEIVRGQARLTLYLNDAPMFRAGTAELTDRGRVFLLEVGEAVNRYPDHKVWVQGHTDAGADAKGFGSDWELSALRAVAVVQYLEKDALVEPKRLAAVAFGRHKPRSGDATKKNGRVEIVLSPIGSSKSDD